MPQTNFDEIVEGGRSVPSGTQQAHITDPTDTTTAPAALTVGTDIAVFTDPPAAAEMALLRTFVNALKADVTALRLKIASLETDVNSTNSKVSAIRTTLEAFQEMATS